MSLIPYTKHTVDFTTDTEFYTSTYHILCCVDDTDAKFSIASYMGCKGNLGTNVLGVLKEIDKLLTFLPKSWTIRVICGQLTQTRQADLVVACEACYKAVARQTQVAYWVDKSEVRLTQSETEELQKIADRFRPL